MGIISSLINLLRQFEGTREIPSPPDVIPESSISVVDTKVIVDYSKLNIPFTLPCKPLRYGMLDTNSMDGLVDYGHNVIYLEPDGKLNHKIMVDWIADQFLSSNGMLAADCVYRIMANEDDDPYDFTNLNHKWYAIHRLYEVSSDEKGRRFKFKGINNPSPDPYYARDSEILWIMSQIIY